MRRASKRARRIKRGTRLGNVNRTVYQYDDDGDPNPEYNAFLHSERADDEPSIWERTSYRVAAKTAPKCASYDKIATTYAKCQKESSCSIKSANKLASATAAAFTGKCKRAAKLYTSAGWRR